MATEIKGNCPECGQDVTLKPDTVTAYLPWVGNEGTYTFPCPPCGEVAVKVMGPEVARLLKLAPGVKWVTPPLELAEHGDGPMLTSDDLLRFAIRLHRADTAEILARAVL